MSFSATINLGTVGVAITSVKLYSCINSSCTGGTVITGYENVSVSLFPLLVSGIPNGTRYILVEALGVCFWIKSTQSTINPTKCRYINII